MATLHTKVILFDDSCPMCRFYTFLFVLLGILEKGNRVGFSKADPKILARIDLVRGRHEIPLYDRETEQTEYGLKALFLVLGSHWPILLPILKSPWTARGLWPVYQLITYNRRVMAGCRACSGFDCAPDLNRTWRSIYLVLTVAIATSLLGTLSWNGRLPTPFLSVFLLWFGILIVAGLLRRSEVARWDHFGNLATILFLFAVLSGTLLILPTIGIVTSIVPVIAIGILGWESCRRFCV